MEDVQSRDVVPQTLEEPTSEVAYRAYECLPIEAGEIRIARLLPALEPSSPLRVDLCKVHLEDGPSYEAVSYTWGTEISLEDIHVSVQDVECVIELSDTIETHPLTCSTTASVKMKSFPLSITRNLEVALRQLRSHNDVRYLWVDAICINQSQPLERNHQVQQMAKIFAQASRVLIWLGEATQMTDPAFDYLDLFNPSDCQKIITKPSRATCNAVNELFDRPWWNRRWVIQEAALAREDPLIICGHRRTSMQNIVLHNWYWYSVTNDSDMLLAFRYMELRSQATIEYDPYQGAPQITVRIDPYEPKWEAKDLIQFYTLGSDYQALDPRDHIYSMLGLAERWYQDHIPVDYESPVSLVYQVAMFAIIQRHNNLNTLTELTEDNRVINLPSWTRDFSALSWASSWSRIPFTKTPRQIRRLLSPETPNPVCASGNIAGTFKHDPDQGILSVSGLVLGTIKLKLEAADSQFADDKEGNSSSRHNLHAYAVFCGVSRSRCEQLIKHKNEIDAGTRPQVTMADVCSLFVLGHEIKSSKDTDDKTRYPSFHTVASLLEAAWQTSTTNDTTWLPDHYDDDELTTYLDEVAGVSTSCSPFVTDSGFMGLGNETLQQTDVVAVLFGADLPAVLRPITDRSQKRYRFVGFAYVHGIMHGEYVGQRPVSGGFDAGDWESKVQAFDLV